MRNGLLVALALTGCADPVSTKTDWVALPSGCFEMGQADGYPEERPVRESCVDAFQMSRTEVTNAQFAAFVAETGYVTLAERADKNNGLPKGSAVFDPRPHSGDLSWWRFMEETSWRRPAGPGGRKAKPRDPVVHVTKVDAEAYAAWVGGRLPTEPEWEYAAKANTQASTDRPLANTWQGVFPTNNTEEDGYRGIAPVGSFPPNSWGLHDMLGNVWELTSTPYSPSHAENDRELAGPNGLDFNQPDTAVTTIKGGSFLCSDNYCSRFRPAARQAQARSLSTSHIGFRVVKSQPASDWEA